jgi:photosystem II stability/assembly factor-like uncharacterized protein
VPGGTAHGIASSGRRFIAATTTGLRASANQGRSWDRMAGPLEGSTTQAICGHPARPGALFAASYGTIFESADGGRSWRKISPEGWPVDSVRQLLVAPGAPDRLLVVTQQQGVFALELR